MNDILFTAKTRGLLRSAGWFPGRDIPVSASDSEVELLPSAVKVLREFGNLSLRTGPHELLEFGPEFTFGKETVLAKRIVSPVDIAEERAVWRHLREKIGGPVSRVAWEEGQDLHAIAVDGNGVVYCATWSYDEASETIDASLMKLADSIDAYLNFWLDHSDSTRSELHVTYPSWSDYFEFSYKPEQ